MEGGSRSSELIQAEYMAAIFHPYYCVTFSWARGGVGGDVIWQEVGRWRKERIRGGRKRRGGGWEGLSAPKLVIRGVSGVGGPLGPQEILSG